MKALAQTRYVVFVEIALPAQGLRNDTRRYPRNTGLAKVLHDHDVGLVEFVLAEEERFTIRRKCHTTKARSWLVESEDRYGLAMSKIEEFNPAVRRKIQVQEVDSVASKGPFIPITNVNRAGVIPRRSPGIVSRPRTR